MHAERSFRSRAPILTGAGAGVATLLASGADDARSLAAALAVTILAYASAVPLFARFARRSQPPPAAAPPPTPDASLISIEHLADPALLVAADWRTLSANAAARTLFGARVAEGDLRMAMRHPQLLDALRLALDGQGPVVRELAGLGAQEGAHRIRATAIGGGRALLTFADVTQARLAERMRADFVANASHELRTPLATISGFIETLLGPAADDAPARQRFLAIMGREADRMRRLIDDLLSLSRIELDKHLRPQTVIDLRPLLSDVGRTLAMRFEADGRVFRVEAPDLPPVAADRDQILQVLHNLLSNALKYGRSGTPILLGASTEAGARGERFVRIAVQDQGDGIAPEHLPRLTERFYRADAGRSRSLGGTGLGLAIVKHIVERHRGRLEIASRPGEGATVAFTLPVAPQAAAAAPDGAAAATATQCHESVTGMSQGRSHEPPSAARRTNATETP